MQRESVFIAEKPDFQPGDIIEVRSVKGWATNDPASEYEGNHAKLVEIIGDAGWQSHTGDPVLNWKVEWIDVNHHILAMPDDVMVLLCKEATPEQIEEAKQGLQSTLRSLQGLTAGERFKKRLERDQEGKATVVTIFYREHNEQNTAEDCLTHVASTWQLAEKWVRNNLDWGGNNPHPSDCWVLFEEVVDSDENVFSTKEDRTYDQAGNCTGRVKHP